jgi:hypothetical protein
MVFSKAVGWVSNGLGVAILGEDMAMTLYLSLAENTKDFSNGKVFCQETTMIVKPN